MNRTFQDLVGKTPTAFFMADGESVAALRVAEDDRLLVLDTYSDCCSETWWADAVGVKQLLGAKVTNVEKIDMPDPHDDRGRQEVDVAYGLRITTERGVCDLIYRNSSNGYYGGSCMARWDIELPEDQAGNVYGAVTVTGWREITEDWSA